MKRRIFGLLAGGSMVAMRAGLGEAKAAATSLGAGLTPLGSEQAGNADGSIPAWTGGLTTPPAGWQPGQYMPDLFPDEQPVVVVDSSNVAGHGDFVTDGFKAMMSKYGFKIEVFPTHRTQAAPQYVYDNIAANNGRSVFVDDLVNGRFGYAGAYGGVPFPVPDMSAPFKAGAQIIQNHISAWNGFCFKYTTGAWCISNGTISEGTVNRASFKNPYYDPSGTLATFDGRLLLKYYPYSYPANLVGQILNVWQYTNSYEHPQEAWELLNGQGRVRRAPEVSFDTPSSQVNGIIGFDEFYGFNGSLEKYDWKCLGKKELYIPYNNNKLFGVPARSAIQANFIDPTLVRFEKHRVWVVEATLHPGERNVLARRVYYVDEDTFQIACSDCYDANDNLFHVGMSLVNCRPDLPGNVYGNSTVNNLQANTWTACTGLWNEAAHPSLQYVDNFPNSLFDPNNMAASAQY